MSSFWCTFYMQEAIKEGHFLHIYSWLKLSTNVHCSIYSNWTSLYICCCWEDLISISEMTTNYSYLISSGHVFLCLFSSGHGGNNDSQDLPPHWHFCSGKRRCWNASPKCKPFTIHRPSDPSASPRLVSYVPGPTMMAGNYFWIGQCSW